jgi:anti-sigma-K factor RskA
MPDHDAIDDRIRRAWSDLTPEDGVHPPLPAAAWARVEAATAEPTAASTSPAPTTAAAEDRGRRPAAPRGRLLLVAAALVLLLGGGLVARATLGPDDPTVAARADLTSEGLDGAPAAEGRADLVELDGHRVLDVSVPDVRAEDGSVLEVWLIDPDSGGLQSLGLVDGATRLPIPDGIDLDRFSVVDVSVEPLDGDPTHSADSAVRGPLAPI